MTRTALLLAALLPLLLAPGTTSAQISLGGGRVTVQGEVGTFAEANGISGAQRRRPAGTGRLYFRPSISLFSTFSVDVDLMLTTEERAFQGATRQSLNKYSVNPRWGWGSASIGDFSEDYSPYTFSGIRVRGAGARIQAGPLELASFGGRARRAVQGGALTGSYSRTLVGGRLQLGDAGSRSIALTLVRAWDDPGSLDEPTDTVYPDMDPDTLFVEDTLSVGIDNQFAVTPQENVVLGLSGSFSLFGDAVALSGEIAGSAYTRDVRSEPIADPGTLDRIPGVARWLFTPRASSNADYAYTVEARVRPFAPLTTTVSFETVGPGSVSLASAGVMSDKRDVNIRTSYRAGRLQARLDLGRARDNLIGQKALTTHRDRISAVVTMRATQAWSVSARMQRATLDNDAADPEQWVDYTSWLAGLRQTLALGRDGMMRSVTVDYTYRPTSDENPLRTTSESQSHSVSASLMLAPSRQVSVTPTLGLVHSRFGEAAWTTRTTYGVGTQVSGLAGKWVSSLNVSRSQFQQTTALQAGLTSRYQVTGSDALILSVQAADYGNLVSPELAFRETTASLRWAHRF